jgi:putative ABC transport system ATP-binding protein
MELLRRVAVQPDRAVIVVTHDSRVYRFGDRIMSMNDGRMEKIQIQKVVDGPQGCTLGYPLPPLRGSRGL